MIFWLVTAAVLALLFARYVLPILSKSHTVMETVRASMGTHRRLLSMAPAEALHATLGELYLTEDLTAVQTGAVISDPDFEAMTGLLLLTSTTFHIWDEAGEELYSCPAEAVALGLPEGWDAMGEASSYFYFLLPTGLALLARRQVELGRPLDYDGFVPRGGRASLAHWDAFLT